MHVHKIGKVLGFLTPSLEREKIGKGNTKEQELVGASLHFFSSSIYGLNHIHSSFCLLLFPKLPLGQFAFPI